MNSLHRHSLRKSRYGAILPTRDLPEFKGNACNNEEIYEFWVRNRWSRIVHDLELLLEESTHHDWVELSREIFSHVKKYIDHLYPNDLTVTCVKNIRMALSSIVN